MGQTNARQAAIAAVAARSATEYRFEFGPP